MFQAMRTISVIFIKYLDVIFSEHWFLLQFLAHPNCPFFHMDKFHSTKSSLKQPHLGLFPKLRTSTTTVLTKCTKSPEVISFGSVSKILNLNNNRITKNGWFRPIFHMLIIQTSTIHPGFHNKAHADCICRTQQRMVRTHNLTGCKLQPSSPTA